MRRRPLSGLPSSIVEGKTDFGCCKLVKVRACSPISFSSFLNPPFRAQMADEAQNNSKDTGADAGEKPAGEHINLRVVAQVRESARTPALGPLPRCVL